MGFPVAKNPPANVGDPRDMGLIPESRRSPGKGNGNPIRAHNYECPVCERKGTVQKEVIHQP